MGLTPMRCAWALMALLLLVPPGQIAWHGSGVALAAPTASSYVDQAIILYDKGDYAKAVDLLKKAIGLNPSYVRAHSWLGLCYAKLGRNREATLAFQQVIVLAPKSEDAKIAQQWITRLQQTTPQPVAQLPAQPSADSPTYLVAMPAATGIADANRPSQVQLFGQIYKKSIVEVRRWPDNPEWRVVYNLQRRFARFRALAGVADGAAQEFQAKFEVRADGKPLHESPWKRAGDVPENLDLDVRGVLQLELFVRGQDRASRDSTVVWADPHIDSRAVAAQLPPTRAPALPSPAPVPPAVEPTSLPVAGTPTPSRSAVLVMPFADSSGTGRNAGTRVSGAIIQELFKLARIDVVSQQRLAEALAGARYDPLDVRAARQVAQRAGASITVVGIVEMFHVAGGVIELIGRTYYKDVALITSFQVINVASGERVLSDSARIGLRARAQQPYQLPGDEDLLREATRRAAVEIAQKVQFAWARQTGEFTLQLTQAVLARNISRDSEFRAQPVGPGTSFLASGLYVYAYISGTGAKPGQRVEFKWYGPDGSEYAREIVVIPPEQQPDQPFTAYQSIRPPAGSAFPAGNWKVEIRIDGYLMKTLTFAVTES